MKPLALHDSIATAISVARGAAPGIALASGLMCPPVLSAPLYRNAALSDVGWIGALPDFSGWAWALEPRGDDEFLVGGGAYQIDGDCDYYCRYYTRDFDITTFGFLASVSGTGPSFDASQVSAALAGTQVLDVALQPDGKAVGVGRTGQASFSKLTIFRLERDGSPDSSFGEGGFVHFASDPTLHHAARAVALEPDGRIVVAGYRGNNEDELLVLRLLADGTLDGSFGIAGVFVGARGLAADLDIRILGTANGGYRVLANNFTPSHELECRLLSLTANGTVSGVSRPIASSSTVESCSSVAVQPDGRMLVAGNIGGEPGHAVVIRLFESGDQDASFATDGLPPQMQFPTALAMAPDGSILVAGSRNGISGTIVARLQASGELDAMYGSQGVSWVDLQSGLGTYQVVNDMYTLPDGGAMLAGGVDGKPFLIRLLANGAIDSAMPPAQTPTPEPPPQPQPQPDPPPTATPTPSAPPPTSNSGGGGIGILSLLLLGLAGLRRAMQPWARLLGRYSGTQKAWPCKGGGES